MSHFDKFKLSDFLNIILNSPFFSSFDFSSLGNRNLLEEDEDLKGHLSVKPFYKWQLQYCARCSNKLNFHKQDVSLDFSNSK